MNNRPVAFAWGASIAVSILLLLATLLLAIGFMWDVLCAYTLKSNPSLSHSIALMLYALSGGLLIFSAVAHLLARLGYQLRLRSEHPPSGPDEQRPGIRPL